MISLKTHNIMDYVLGAFLILSPALFGFSSVLAARNIFLVLGFGLIGYSLITDYQYSMAKIIPLSVHMALDVMAGVALILAPALFDYRPALSGFQYAVHFITGGVAIGLVAFTKPQSQTQAREEETTYRKSA